MNSEMTPIVETNNFIVLDEYKKQKVTSDAFQSEAELERELISDLEAQGYEYRKDIASLEAMMDNLKTQLETLNKTTFTSSEWQRFAKNILKSRMTQLQIKQKKFKKIIYMILRLMMGIFKIFIFLIKKILPEIMSRLLINLNKKEYKLIVMMLQF